MIRRIMHTHTKFLLVLKPFVCLCLRLLIIWQAYFLFSVCRQFANYTPSLHQQHSCWQLFFLHIKEAVCFVFQHTKNNHQLSNKKGEKDRQECAQIRVSAVNSFKKRLYCRSNITNNAESKNMRINNFLTGSWCFGLPGHWSTFT